MKADRLKLYLISVTLSAVIVGLPWLLAAIGVLPELTVLSSIAFPSAGAALAVSAVILFRSGLRGRDKILLFALNPVFVYLAVLIAFFILIYRLPWEGFTGLTP